MEYYRVIYRNELYETVRFLKPFIKLKSGESIENFNHKIIRVPETVGSDVRFAATLHALYLGKHDHYVDYRCFLYEKTDVDRISLHTNEKIIGVNNSINLDKTPYIEGYIDCFIENAQILVEYISRGLVSPIRTDWRSTFLKMLNSKQGEKFAD